jgi:hypothetical protein
MAQGDKLYSLLNPNSTEVQVRKLKRKVERATRVGRGFNSNQESMGGYDDGGAQGGGKGGSDFVPAPPPEDFILSYNLNYSGDGIIKPSYSIQFPSYLLKIRGFMGFNYRVSTPTGDVRTGVVNTPEPGTSAYDGFTSFAITNLDFPGAASQTLSFQFQVRSSIYGNGRWTTISTASLDKDTTAPGTPVGVAVESGKLNQVRVSWTQPTEADYFYTEVVLNYLTVITSATKTVGTSSKGAMTFSIDPQFELAPYSLKLRHFDKSGNASAYCADTSFSLRTILGADITNGTVTDTKLAGIKDVTKLSPRIGNSLGDNPLVFLDDSNNPVGDIDYGNVALSQYLRLVAYGGLTSTQGTVQGSYVGDYNQSYGLRSHYQRGNLFHGGVGFALKSYTSSGTIDNTSNIVRLDSSGGNRIFTLPTNATSYVNYYLISRVDSTSANNCFIAPNLGQTIEGSSTSFPLRVGKTVVFWFDPNSSVWRTISELMPSGSVWVTKDDKEINFVPYGGGPPPWAATQTPYACGLVSDISYHWSRFGGGLFVSATQDVSNYWTITVFSVDNSNGTANILTFNTKTGNGGGAFPANAWTRIPVISTFLSTDVAAGSLNSLEISVTPTGSPGSLYLFPNLIYKEKF